MISANLRSRFTLLQLSFLFCFGLSLAQDHAYARVVPKNLQVIDLDRAPLAADLSNAREAFQNGSAIIRIIGPGKEELARFFQVQLPEVDVTSGVGPNSDPSTVKIRERLKLQVVAAYIDGDGIVRSLQTFAPAKLSENIWHRAMQEWITKESSRAAGTLLDDPTPPGAAWTTLSVNTAQASINEGYEEDNISVYRLNTIDPTSDYYMVYTVPSVTPTWDGQCDGIFYCGWHTYSRHFETGMAGNGTLTEHGPTGTIGSSTASFSIGGSVGPTGPNANATFGVSWTQSDVTTDDHSTTSSGVWDEKFGNAWIRCDPALGNVPATSSGTFFSRQGAIFKVRSGTTTFQPTVQADVSLCSYNTPGHVGFASADLHMSYKALLGPPLLSGFPANLTIPAGATSPLLVNAYIPASPQGLQWNITSNHSTSWLTVPTGNSFSASRIIPVSVAAGTAVGSQGTLSLDTVPPFAAPSVTSGPLLINVTVGTPKQTSRAGVLLLGGVDIFGKIADTVFYDMNSKQGVPVGQPSVPRYLHTSTQLNSGEILVVGGATAVIQTGVNTPLTSVSELYEPASASFKPTGSLAVSRFLHAAVLLPDGKVLIVGGQDQQLAAVQTAELYDPASGTFTAAGSMTIPRKGTVTATLISGPGEPARVLVYGGTVTGDPTRTEIWSEADRSFSPGLNMQAYQVQFPTPVESAPGQFEVVGGLGSNNASIPQTQILTIPSSFQFGPNLNISRQGHTLTTLASGQGVLVTGGGDRVSGETAELKRGNKWTVLSGGDPCPGSPGCLVAPRFLHTATLLPDGTVLLAGGRDANGHPQGSTEIFNPPTGQFAPGPVLPTQSRQTANFISTSDVSLTAGPPSTIFGQKVTMVAAVTVGFGSASGKVTFLDSGSQIATVPVTAGKATFDTSALAAGTHTLSARYLGDSVNLSATSDAVTVEVGTNQTSVSLTSSLNPSGVGEAVRFAAEVSSASSVPTGSVTFKDGTALLEVVPLSGGVAAYRTAALAAGDHIITATYSGDSAHASGVAPPLTQKVLQVTTTTTLTASPATITYGKTLSLTAVVSGGTGPITGAVLFKDGGTTLGTVDLTNAQATLPAPSLTAGSHSFTATYTGDSSHATSTSSTVPATVRQATPGVTITSSKNPSNFGQPITFVARVLGAGTAAPGGTVTFSEGASTIGSPQPVVGGKANISTSSLSKGAHFISAAYSGDTNYASAGSTALNQEVNGAVTQTTLQSSLNPSEAGQTVTFVAVVSGSMGTPTGSIRILDGAAQLGVATLLSGTGAVSTSSLKPGSHVITAVYAGDSTNAGSTSSPLTQVVNKSATSITLSASPSEPLFAQSVELVALLNGAASTGNVVFTDRGTRIGSGAVLNGKATLRTASLLPGIHLLVATYRGDPTHGPGQSAPVTVRVQMGSTEVRITSNHNPSEAGQPVTLRAIVSTPFGSPTGSVTFTDGSAPIGSAQPLVKGTAAITTSALTTGPHVLAATYSGDTDYTASTSPNLIQTVNAAKAPVILTLVSSPNPSLTDQAVLFTAVVKAASGPVPTGSITISEGSTLYGSGTLVAGSGIVRVSSMKAGIHEVRATYGGDETHLGATSPPVVQQVNAGTQ